jgi:4-carboxymuconolactone decarboxylase
VTGALARAEGLLVELSAALASRREASVAAALLAARDGGADPATVEEVILQAYLFLGYPAALNGFALWRELSGLAARAPSAAEWERWHERGERLCRVVYGEQFDALQENVRGLHPDLATWMLVEGYGKVIAREGLELRVRELCIVALLAVLDAPRQLFSHLRGALHAGATPGEVDDALGRALAYADEGARARGLETWKVVRGRWSARADASEE